MLSSISLIIITQLLNIYSPIYLFNIVITVFTNMFVLSLFSNITPLILRDKVNNIMTTVYVRIIITHYIDTQRGRSQQKKADLDEYFLRSLCYCLVYNLV